MARTGRGRIRLLGALVAAGVGAAACGQNGKKPQTGVNPPASDSTASTTASSDSLAPGSLTGNVTSTSGGPTAPGTTTRSATTTKAAKAGGTNSTSSTAKPQQPVQITPGPSTAPSQP